MLSFPKYSENSELVTFYVLAFFSVLTGPVMGLFRQQPSHQMVMSSPGFMANDTKRTAPNHLLEFNIKLQGYSKA